MKIKVETNFLHEHSLPMYESDLAAGVDLRANIEETIILQPMQRILIPTGIKMELPDGYEFQVRPRSGLAIKFGITVLNSPGTVDPDYRGDVGVILINLSNKGFEIKKGDRIAQGVLAKFERIQWTDGRLSETKRGEGGFGSSDKEVNKSEHVDEKISTENFDSVIEQKEISDKTFIKLTEETFNEAVKKIAETKDIEGYIDNSPKKVKGEHPKTKK